MAMNALSLYSGGKKIFRVFPRRTNATPMDDYAYAYADNETIFQPPTIFLPEMDEIHVSVTYTYDRAKAERIEKQWQVLGVPVKVGGPAYDDRGGEFLPGMYIQEGYTMTSRGCNNNCWFCMVPKREGKLREIGIHAGHNILDSNLLQCSDAHINSVFNMLEKEKAKPLFTGGLEAKLLKPWHCQCMKELGTKEAFFAYDTPKEYDALVEAGRMMRAAGFTTKSNTLMCYVLIGYKGDTFDKAEKRLQDTVKAGFFPSAMLYRDETGKVERKWEQYQRTWFNRYIVGTKVKKIRKEVAI